MSEPATFQPPAEGEVMDFLAPPPPAVRPIGVNEAEVEFYATADRDSFVGALIPLAKQACVVLAWRAARRVYVVTDLRKKTATQKHDKRVSAND